ncbi:MAG: hypothetical protein MUC60_09995 [Oscillatoria sp. Prado101]|nr:hypothetical protein [Oscillatoria sp. Prado101]
MGHWAWGIGHGTLGMGHWPELCRWVVGCRWGKGDKRSVAPERRMKNPTPQPPPRSAGRGSERQPISELLSQILGNGRWPGSADNFGLS